MPSVAERVLGAVVTANNERVRRHATDATQPNPRPLAGCAWNAELEAAWPDLRAEWDAFAASGGRLPRIEDLIHESQGNEGTWRAGLLVSRGRPVDALADRFPTTQAALARVPGLWSALWSELEPGASLHEHVGPNAGVLRYHLGIDCGDYAALRVGDVEVPYRDGHGILFDDTAPHAAWNHGPRSRITLVPRGAAPRARRRRPGQPLRAADARPRSPLPQRPATRGRMAPRVDGRWHTAPGTPPQMSDLAERTDRTPKPWDAVPLAAPRHREPSPGRDGALLAAMAMVGPVVRAWTVPSGHPSAVAAAATLAAIALVALGVNRPWWARAIVIATAAGAVVPIEGRLVGAWLFLALLVASWSVIGRAPLPALPPAERSATAPTAVLLAVAAWAGADLDATIAPLVIAGVAGVPPAVSTLGGGWLERTSHRIGRAAGGAVAAVTFSLLSLLVLLVPWGTGRLTGWNPLDRGPAGWAARERRHPRADSLWMPDAAAAPSRSRSLRGAANATLTVAVAVAVVAAGAALVRSITADDAGAADQRGFTLAPDDAEIAPTPTDELDEPTDPPADGAGRSTDGRPAAYQGQDWYGEYLADFGWLFREDVAWRPLDQYRLRDVTTRHVNVIDRERRSWVAPPCSCRRLSVWLYGGSAAFGLGQRDEHTIASHLARIAHAEGITVDVHNRGMPGDLHWNAAQRFAWDLVEDPPPDLVLFYDGANELWGAHSLNQEELGDIRRPIDPLVEDIWRELDRVPDQVPPGPAGAELQGDLPARPLSTAETGRLAADRYDRSRKLSSDTATANGLPIRWYWQPSRVSRPLVAAEPHGDDSTEAYLREFYGSAAAALPDDVVDLSDVFSQTTEPLFSDEVHHNEEGARLVALALYRNLAGDLRRLQETS
jgi:hypothetical protein